MREDEWLMFRQTLTVALEKTFEENARGQLLSNAGRMMERRVEAVLTSATNQWGEKVFKRVIRNEPNTRHFDRKGMDFTVRKMVNSRIRTVHFGISISSDCRRRSALRHAGVPQVYIPLHSTAKSIVDKITALFD